MYVVFGRRRGILTNRGGKTTEFITMSAQNNNFVIERYILEGEQKKVRGTCACVTLAGARAGAMRENRFDKRAGVGGRRRLGWRAADRTLAPDVGLWRHTARPVRLLRARAPRGRQLFFSVFQSQPPRRNKNNKPRPC